MRALASSDSRASRAMRVSSIACCVRRSASAAAARSAPTRSASRRTSFCSTSSFDERLAHAIARGAGVLERVTKRRRGVDRREHFAPGGFDVGLEPLDLAVGRVVGARAGGQHRRRAIALGIGGHRRGAPRLERRAGRLAARVERLGLGHDRRDARLERARLLAVERDLLLLAVDGELAGVSGFARGRRARFRLDQLDPQPAQVGFDIGDLRRRGRLARPRFRQPGTRRRQSSRRAAGTCAPAGLFHNGGVRRAVSGSGAPSRPAASASRAASRPRTRCRRCA